MNKFIGIGRLAKDPELKMVGANNDVALCNFTIAINRRFKNKQTGEYPTDWLNCTAFGKTAEFIQKYFSKGKMIGIVGSVQTRSWDADDGTKRYATEIHVEEAHFTGSKNDDEPTQTEPAQTYNPDMAPDNDAGLPFDL